MGKQWDKIFKKHGKVFTKLQENIPEIIRLFKKKSVKRILDLGCGSGRHTVYLAKNGFEVYGIDISLAGIRITKEWLKKEKLKANLKIGDIYKKLPYKDNFFDAIISTNTLHHAKIEKIRKLIKEMERILKADGLIFITVRRASKIKDWKKNKILIYKFTDLKTKKVNEIKYKIIGPRIYVPTEGGEKDLIHFCFNKKIIKREFKNFKISYARVRTNHYCLIGKLKNNAKN